jgi:O-glycosyl hydrolase
MTRTLKAFFAAIPLLCVAVAGAQEREPSAHIQINPSQEYQQIQGFGVNFTGPYFRDEQKAMFDKLIDDLGVTMFRVVPYLVYSNWEETNDNDDPNSMNWEYYNDRYSTRDRPDGASARLDDG